MLVINSNTSENVTNYMLTDPGYPDVESILMWGGPQYQHFEALANNSNVTVGITDLPVIDNIGGEAINYYCPRFYKSSLMNGSIARTDLTTIGGDFAKIPDFCFYNTSSNGSYKYTVDVTYRIAVKGLPTGSVIGEKIIAPLMFGVDGANNSINYYISYTSFTIKFRLLHTDGTFTDIATITPSRVGGNVPYVANYLVGGVAAVGNVIHTGLRLGSYYGVGQAVQDGDILVADVHYEGDKRFVQGGGGIYYGSTNNITPWDLNGFRPFQVSIRDA